MMRCLLILQMNPNQCYTEQEMKRKLKVFLHDSQAIDKQSLNQRNVKRISKLIGIVADYDW